MLSEVDVAADPEQVGAAAEDALRLVDEDRRPERRVLPVEVELDPAVGVPVDAEVDHRDVVGPEAAVGEVVFEEDIPQVELAIADERLDGARAPFPTNEAERPQGHDCRPTLDVFAGHEVGERDVVALHGDLGLVPQAGPGHLEFTDVPLRLEREAAVIVGQVDCAEEAVALVDRALVEVEEDGRGVGGGLVILGGLHRGPQRQGGLVPRDLADGTRGADVQVAQGREPVGAEERSEVEIADGFLVRVVVGQPGEVAVEPAERPVEPAFPGPPPGHQTGLARQPEVQGEQRPLGRNEVLLKVVEPVIAVGHQETAELDLERFGQAEVEVAVEQVPGALEAALERHLVFPEPGQSAFEVEPHPGDIEAALAEGAVVGDEELEVGLVEDMEPEVELVILGGELEPVGEPGPQREFAGGVGPAHLAGPPEVRAAGGPLAGHRRGLRLGGGTWLAQPALELAGAILQLAVPPGRLLAVAVELLKQAGVHLFDPPEPLLERGRLGWIRQGCRWLAVRKAAVAGRYGQNGGPAAEGPAEPKAGDRLAHPTLSSETGRAKGPGYGSFRLLKDRHTGGLVFNEKGRGSFSLLMRTTEACTCGCRCAWRYDGAQTGDRRKASAGVRWFNSSRLD